MNPTVRLNHRRHQAAVLAQILAGALALLALACAQNPPPQSVATTAGGRPPVQVAERPIGPGPEVPKMDIAPSHGTCAPEKKTPFALVACCNGKEACSGQCVHTVAGEVACACYETPGGCREGQVCCRFRHACTAALDCAPPE